MTTGETVVIRFNRETSDPKLEAYHGVTATLLRVNERRKDGKMYYVRIDAVDGEQMWLARDEVE